MNDQARAREQPVVRGVANDAEIGWQFQRIRAAPAWIEKGSLAVYSSNHGIEQRARIEPHHAAESDIDWRVARGEKAFEQGTKGGRVYTKDKKSIIVFYPATKRLEVFGTMRANFLMCGIGSDGRGFLHNKGAVVSEALVPFGQARPFPGGCDRSGGVE
jgi:hypothetical protein